MLVELDQRYQTNYHVYHIYSALVKWHQKWPWQTFLKNEKNYSLIGLPNNEYKKVNSHSNLRTWAALSFPINLSTGKKSYIN